MHDLIAPLIASLMIYHSAQCVFHRTTMFSVFIFCTSHCLCFPFFVRVSKESRAGWNIWFNSTMRGIDWLPFQHVGLVTCAFQSLKVAAQLINRHIGWHKVGLKVKKIDLQNRHKACIWTYLSKFSVGTFTLTSLHCSFWLSSFYPGPHKLNWAENGIGNL